MNNQLSKATAISEILLICPESKRIFRLSEAIRGPLRIDSVEPAEVETDAWGDLDLRKAEIKFAADVATSQKDDARSDAAQEILTGLPEGIADITPSNLRWLGGKTWIHFRGMQLKTQEEVTVEIINAINGPLDCTALRSPVTGKNVGANVYRMVHISQYEVRAWDPSRAEDWTKARPGKS